MNIQEIKNAKQELNNEIDEVLHLFFIKYPELEGIVYIKTESIEVSTSCGIHNYTNVKVDVIL